MTDRPQPTGRGNLFVSGRLCLFGEHSDWAAQYGIHPGYCVVIGTDQGMAAEVAPSEDFCIESRVPDAHGRDSGRSRLMRCPMELSALRAAAEDELEFFRYCAGTAHEILRGWEVSGGLKLRIRNMDLPLRKGVSSSAAVCILVAKAFDQLYRLGMFPHELMEVAYRGETLTGSQCGRMDQACIYGKVPVLLTFRKAAEPRVEPLSPGGEIPMFFVDLAGKKDTVRILAELRGAYLASERLQRGLGSENERIVRRACRLLADGDGRGLGQLMTEAQEVFDRLVAPHSPRELASRLLHELLAGDVLAEHVWGGKGVGSQGDGTAQFVARSEQDRRAAMDRIHGQWPQMRCFPLSILSGTGQG
jgi:galactokinase